MYWEEKIDKIKKESDPRNFKVPFTDWSIILKKIESKFVKKENSDFIFSNWDYRLKEKRHIKTILTASIDGELDRLDSSQNYWLVLTRDKANFKNLVYDCKPTVIKILIELWKADFYIVDKRYTWLVYFKRHEADTEIFKSGGLVTPFDKI
ncbi:DUF6756 family protein [Jiulongibacter sp. NS-SX5]|uniref:DUF6756 family protein n=1 Tax=Jiulongibacter sp. NS-SX5 TaxID=3463854 RepID=UPI004058AEC0